MAGKRTLVEIRVLVEIDDDDDAGDGDYLGQLIGQIERLICPFDPAGGDHPEKCPRRWFVLASTVDPDDAAEWEDLLNE